MTTLLTLGLLTYGMVNILDKINGILLTNSIINESKGTREI